MPAKSRKFKKRNYKKKPIVKYVQKPLGPLFPPTMLAKHKIGKTITLIQTDKNRDRSRYSNMGSSKHCESF